MNRILTEHVMVNCAGWGQGRRWLVAQRVTFEKRVARTNRFSKDNGVRVSTTYNTGGGKLSFYESLLRVIPTFDQGMQFLFESGIFGNPFNRFSTISCIVFGRALVVM